MAKNWNACTDGLLPIAESLHEFARATVSGLNERLKYTSTRPSFALAGPWSDVIRLADVGQVTRRQLTREWLRQNRTPDVASEFDSRLSAVYSKLTDWEDRANDKARWNSTDIHIRQFNEEKAGLDPRPAEMVDHFGEDLCEEYQEIAGLADEAATWIRLLAKMIGDKQRQQSAPALEQNCWLGGAQLADLFKLSKSAVEKRMERFRNDDINQRDWRDVPNPTKGNPKYQHRLSAVRPILEEMAKESVRELSAVKK